MYEKKNSESCHQGGWNQNNRIDNAANRKRGTEGGKTYRRLKQIAIAVFKNLLA